MKLFFDKKNHLEILYLKSIVTKNNSLDGLNSQFELAEESVNSNQ